jgi:hypothetical protein
MRRLATEKLATLDLDDGAGVLECVVVGVAGPWAQLRATDPIEECLRELLAAGLSGYLLFTHNGAPVGLRGVSRVDPNGPTLDFVVIDGVQLPERRGVERAPVQLHARMFEFDEEGRELPAVETETIDVSLGGALVEPNWGPAIGQRIRVELFLDSEPSALRTEAMVVRKTGANVALRFVRLTNADRDRLARLLAHHARATARAVARSQR